MLSSRPDSNTANTDKESPSVRSAGGQKIQEQNIFL